MVILIFAWALVLARGQISHIGEINRRSLFCLVLSGLVTGISWLAHSHALQTGAASQVVLIDKLCLVWAAALAVISLHETVSFRHVMGLVLGMAGV